MIKLKLGPKVKFKKAKLPEKKKLVGNYTILEPLNVSKHSKDIYSEYLKDKKNIIWTYLPYGPFKTYLNFRNTLFTILKNEPKRKLFWLIPTRLILDGIAGGLFLFQGKFAHIKSILRAHFSFYSSFSTMVKKRKIYTEKIQKVSISTTPNKIGIYQGSMVWQYYIKKVKFFKNLK